jgi:hypothetical protein
MRCALLLLIVLIVMARGVDVRDPSFPVRFPAVRFASYECL